MATVTSPTTPSTLPVVQRAKRQYGRPRLAVRPDVPSGATGCAKDSTMESSSVVEDSEPERVRYRECFASTDLSDPPTSAIKNRSFGNWRHELERIDAEFDSREDVTASPVKSRTSKTATRASRSQTDPGRTLFGMRSESKEDTETSASKDRSGVLSSAKSGSSRHPSSSPERDGTTPPPVAPHHRDEKGERNTIHSTRAQTTKGIARVFEDSGEEEEGNPVQRPTTQRHGSDGMRSLHETEASPGVRSTQGTKRGGKRLSRRCADGNGTMTPKKQSKPKAREAPRFLGDGDDGDDELPLESDRKGKSKETIPDEKEIEAFLADASGEEVPTKKGGKRKPKSEKSKGPKEKPLTKKQLIEMEKETAKMKAERTVDAQASAIWHPRTIIGFLRRTLSKGKNELTTLPPPPRHITPPPMKQPSSDPIIDTAGSSSPDVASNQCLATSAFRRPDAPAAQAPEFMPAPTTAEPFTPPAQKNNAFVPHPSDYEDDDEPADLEEVRLRARQQKEADNKAKEMQQAAYKKKMAALRAKSNIPVVDDDDELEVESPKKLSLKRKHEDTSDEEATVKPKPITISKGRAIQAQFGAVKTKPIVAGGRKDVVHAGLSHKQLNQMLLIRATEQKLAVIKAKEEDYEARGGRLRKRQRVVTNGPSYAELIEALERAPLPGENHAEQDPDQDDGDYQPETESPCKGKAFVADSGFVEDEIKVKIEEEEVGLPFATFTEDGLGSPLPVNAQLFEDENPFPLHLRPTQPRRLHGTDSEDDNPFPLHLRPKQPRRLHGTDSENEDANPFPPHLRPKRPRRIMSSDEEGGNAPTQGWRSNPTGKARDSIKPLGEPRSHHNLGTCSAATGSTESLNSVQLPEPDPRERLFSSIPAVPPPLLARNVNGSFEMYSDSGADMIRHHSANTSFNLPTFEPLACLPDLPSPALPSPSIHMTPVAPLSTPSQASTSKVSPGGSLLPAKDNYQLTAKGVYYFNLESGHQEFLDRPRTPPPKGDAITFGGITSQLFFSQADSSSETGSPAEAPCHGKSPVKPVSLETQMQPSSQPPAQVEDADEEPVIRPIKKVSSFAFTKSESPEPASKPVDPLAHLRVPIATEGFGFTQEVEGSGPLPELKLNTQEAAEFRRVEAQDLDDLLREKVETRKAEIIEALAAGQPADPSWLNDYGMFTQTKPRVSSPLSPRTIMAWPFTPSPPESPIKVKPSSSDAESSPRKPGRGLKRKADLEADKEADESSSPRKIARTESTENIAGPSDAFAVMMANRQLVDAKKEKRRQRKIAEKEELESIEKEFVVGEADESDDELDFGFGKTQKTDDEEVQGDEPTAEDKAMVDDRVLGAHELKEDAVIEKHKEHLEEDDAALQKIHEAAVAGKLRGGKKRGRDVAMSDSESEDEEYHRRPKSKKRKVAGDKLEDLARNDETKAFYAAYQNDLEDQNDDLKHLNIVHDHIPGIEDAADPVGDEDVDIEGDVQEASWKRDAGVSDSIVDEEEHYPSPETGDGNDFDLDRFVGDAYPSSPGALSPQKFAEMDLRRRPTTKLDNADDLHYPLSRHRYTVNAQWAKEQSKTYETSARCGAATGVTGARRARRLRLLPPDIKRASKGLSREGTLGSTLKKCWDEE